MDSCWKFRGSLKGFHGDSKVPTNFKLNLRCKSFQTSPPPTQRSKSSETFSIKCQSKADKNKKSAEALTKFRNFKLIEKLQINRCQISLSDPSKSSQCSSLSDGESYECFGENDHMTTMEAQNTSAVVDKDGVDLDLAPHFQR